MEYHTVEHQIFHHRQWKKKILLQLLLKKRFRKRFFLSSFFFSEVMKESTIPCVDIESLVSSKQLVLENFFSRNGNISSYEIMAICSILAEHGPKNLLEIGTFDGNTTLQMAFNTPDDAIIHTLDLPSESIRTHQPVLKSDIQFIEDQKKQKRKFEESSVAYKIHQHFGDSTQCDFSQFTKRGSLDFIFIDGGHSYECVQSDTENALKVLAKGGMILWHDFTPLFGGVYAFLCELSKKLPLKHIKETNLVIYKGDKRLSANSLHRL